MRRRYYAIGLEGGNGAAEVPALSGDRHTDVLIIGGGIAGILMAYLLRQSGVDCILAEKGRICSGTTGNTTAKITVQHGLIYDKLLQSGKEKAEKYLAANQAAFDRYATLCAQIDCYYERKDNAYADAFSPSRGMLKPQLLVNGFEAVKNLLTPSGRRCPHLGCALKWNAAEHSWDCPCHGSRFSEDGKVLDNPANGNLR